MKRILFNDKYGLTKAVLEGRKTMTRRSVKIDSTNSPFESFSILPYNEESDRVVVRRLWHGSHNTSYHLKPKYKPGEVVAVAQSYKDTENYPESYIIDEFHSNIEFEAGWNNKMFVRADLMIHQIRITDVRVERLQDISDEDCRREGISKSSVPGQYYVDGLQRPRHNDGVLRSFTSPREAFAALINKISGNGTWESNPWVFVYEFELV